MRRLTALEAKLGEQDWHGIVVEDRVALQSEGTHRKSTRSIEFCFREGRKKFDILRIPPTDANTAYAVNDRYAFEIDRDPGQKGYYVSDYYPGTTGQTHVFTGLAHYAALPFASVMVDDQRLADQLQGSPPRQITEENERVFVEWTGPGETPVYRAVLDKTLDWAVVEWQVILPTYTINQANTFNPEVAGAPFPKEIKKVLTEPNGKVVDEFTYSFEPPSKCEASDAEFTLSAYGLPEVHVDQGTSGTVRILFILANVAVVLVIAYVLWQRFRKHA